MLKFRFYLDKDAETKWLNEMSANGWACTHFFAGIFSFEKCECNQYAYQVDFERKFFMASDEYTEFMRDTNVEIVQSWGYWRILRKLVSEGAFELYTDAESKIEYYRKILIMFKIVTVLELVCLWIELMAAVFRGVPYAVPAACLLVVIVIACVNMTLRTANKINELKEIQTGIAVKRRRNISVLLAMGMLVNACALLLKDEVSDYIVHPMQILAVILMLAGIWHTARKRNK